MSEETPSHKTQGQNVSSDTDSTQGGIWNRKKLQLHKKTKKGLMFHKGNEDITK